MRLATCRIGLTAVWLCLLRLPALAQDAPVQVSTTIAPDRFSDEFKARWLEFFQPEEFLDKLVRCQQDAGMGCDIIGMGTQILEVSNLLKTDIDRCKANCTLNQATCERFWAVTVTDLVKRRDKCALTNSWPSSCLIFTRDLTSRVKNQSWELPVMCSIMLPESSIPVAYGNGTPPCSTLVMTTVANRASLTNDGCRFGTKEKCVTNLCNNYEQFFWRMRPRNLQNEFDTDVKDLFPQDFLLRGCEYMQNLTFNMEECQKRVDLGGFCDCLCPSLPTIQKLGFANCKMMVDGYFMFGRFGLEGMSVPKDCEPEVCRVMDEQRLSPTCAGLNVPNLQECKAIQISTVPPGGNPCPWKHHSGEDDVLVCLDGHRCSISEEGWACCASNHRGRGQCPANLPMMCTTLCSGITEYCCKKEGECTPRVCPVLMENYYELVVPITTTTTTVPPGASLEGADDKEQVRVPEGWWVWLLLFLPCFWGGIGILYCKYRIDKVAPESDAHVPTTMDYENDKFGRYNVVRMPARDSDPVMPRCGIVMPELPAVRPLGLELVELRVIRVYPWGAKHGWKVGDIIVDIAGTQVRDFAELWDRIQVERNRPPVRFTVERWSVIPTLEEEEAADKGLRSIAAAQAIADADKHDASKFDSKSRGSSKIGPDPATMSAEALRDIGTIRADDALRAEPGVPGAMHGWDNCEEDESSWDNSEEDYSETPSKTREAAARELAEVNYKSRFSAAFEVVVSPKASKKGKAAVDALKEGAKKVPMASQSNPVMFTKDAWGRSVVKVLDTKKNSGAIAGAGDVRPS